MIIFSVIIYSILILINLLGLISTKSLIKSVMVLIILSTVIRLLDRIIVIIENHNTNYKEM